MPYCPKCPDLGNQTGKYCYDCGNPLPLEPATGDKLNIRSPEARAESHVNQHFHLGDAPPDSKPTYQRCPQCGRRNQVHEVFDCMGECGREHLCLRHQDEEYEVCVRCARALRKVDEQEVAILRKLEAERDKWSAQANKLERALAGLKDDKGDTEKRLSQNQKELAQAQQALREAQARVSALEKELAQWRRRAESAEAKLAETERRQREARQAPIWQKIGIEMVKIPEGEFLYGDDKKKVYLGAYHLAKTPVTNAQYKAFVDATGHRSPTHWKNGNIPNGKENHPVVYVSWDDAQAFCQWASLRLPTEQEWEKGARGTDGRRYPWGDQEPNANLCNFDGNVGDTTSVTRYGGGASPYGLLDMAGNVWDWCEDWYDSDHDERVLRGGSWSSSQHYVRSAYRGFNTPDNRINPVGFRCAAPS